jgi:hypothetical protein
MPLSIVNDRLADPRLRDGGTMFMDPRFQPN